MSTPTEGSTGESTRESTGDVGALTRDLWSTRPWREPHDRILAGVAAAVARRYAIDPTLVRVVFIVAAFFGIGFFLYLALWVVLPNRATGGRMPLFVAVVALLVALVTFTGTSWGAPEALIGLIVAGALLLALHHSRGHLVATPPLEPGAGPPADPGRALPVPPPLDGDPVRAAAPPPPRPRSHVVALTLAAALVAAGGVGLLGLAGWLPTGTTPVLGTALAVVGVGLIVGATRRAGRSLILVAVPLALVLFAAAEARTWYPPMSSAWSTWGAVVAERSNGDGGFRSFDTGTWAASDAAQVRPSYGTGVGDATLDLRGLPPGPPVTTTVDSGVGDVLVLVGPDADVTAVCASGAGVVDCLGAGTGRVVSPGSGGGPRITVSANSGAGDVTVARA